MLSGGAEEAPPKTLRQKDSVLGLSDGIGPDVEIKTGGAAFVAAGVLVAVGFETESLEGGLGASVGLLPSSFSKGEDEAAPNIP